MVGAHIEMLGFEQAKTIKFGILSKILMLKDLKISFSYT